MERRPPAGPSNVLDERHPAVDHVVLSEADRPPRRRRSALLGGGLLIAASPVAVGAGVFVPGFAALGLGALLLLLPPRERRERSDGTRLRVVRSTAAVVRRRAAAFARWIAHVVARVFRAVAHFVATTGRDGAVLIGRATLASTAAIARGAARVGSRSWSAAQAWAPRAWRRLVAAARALARDARSATVRAWIRIQPLLRRAWSVSLAGSQWTVREVGGVAHSASKRLSAYIDSRSRPR